MTDTHLPILNIKTTKSFSDFTYTGGRPDITHWRRNDNPPSLKLKVHKPQRERLNKAETSDELISSICTGINWTNLCELDLYDLSVNMTRFPETLARTFGTLPNICTVIVGSTSANPFLEALLLGLDEDLINLPASIAFPGLRHLKMWEVAFDRFYSFEAFQAGSHAVDIGRLQDCLMNRYERGVEISELTLLLCRRLKADQVRKLSEIVVNVDWDEETFGYSDDPNDDSDDDDFVDDPFY